MSIIDDILRREGSKYTNHPSDRGGPTKWGITQAVLSEVRGKPASEADVAALTEAEARSIYEARYIRQPRFDQIANAALRDLVIDCGVNHGPGRAARWLQDAAGVTADGAIGPKTLTAVNGADPRVMYCKVLAARVRFYGRIIADDPRQAAFAAGWANRAAEFIVAL